MSIGCSECVVWLVVGGELAWLLCARAQCVIVWSLVSPLFTLNTPTQPNAQCPAEPRRQTSGQQPGAQSSRAHAQGAGKNKTTRATKVKARLAKRDQISRTTLPVGVISHVAPWISPSTIPQQQNNPRTRLNSKPSNKTKTSNDHAVPWGSCSTARTLEAYLRSKHSAPRANCASRPARAASSHRPFRRFQP